MKKLYFALMALGLSLTANAADYYLVGGFNGWNPADANCKFTESTDGNYTLDLNETLISGFKITDGSWTGSVNLGSNGSKLVVGEPYAMVQGSNGNVEMDGNIANPHLVFNPAASTLLITGQEAEVEYAYVLHGNFDGSTVWTNIDLTEKDGKWVSKPTEVAACGFGIKKVDKATQNQLQWISSAETGVVTLDTPLPLVVEGTNFSIAAGTYTFSVDPTAMTLTVTGKGGDDPEPPTPSVAPDALYVIGNLSVGQWSTTAEGTVALTKDGNIFTGQINVTDATLGKGEPVGYFSFLTTTGEDLNAVNSADRYGSLVADAPIKDETPVEMKKYAVGVDASAATSWKVAAGVYNVTVNFETMQVVLKAATDAVEEIEAAEGEAVYFNLQGVQVENPVNGVYVKVLNGKATKVVVK